MTICIYFPKINPVTIDRRSENRRKKKKKKVLFLSAPVNKPDLLLSTIQESIFYTVFSGQEPHKTTLKPTETVLNGKQN